MTTRIERYNLGERIVELRVVEALPFPAIAKECNKQLLAEGSDEKVTARQCSEYYFRTFGKLQRIKSTALEELLKKPVDIMQTLEKNVNRLQVALDKTMTKDGDIRPSDRALFLRLVQTCNESVKIMAEVQGRIQSANIINVNMFHENVMGIARIIAEDTRLDSEDKRRLIENIEAQINLALPVGGTTIDVRGKTVR